MPNPIYLEESLTAEEAREKEGDTPERIRQKQELREIRKKNSTDQVVVARMRQRQCAERLAAAMRRRVDKLKDEQAEHKEAV